MTLAVVERWFNNLPTVDRDLPLLILNNIAYTPREALNQVSSNTEIGKGLQSLVEHQSFGTTFADTWSLAKIRLELNQARKEDTPLFAVMSVPVKTFTPSQLVQEIRNETPLGKQWINAEIGRMTEIMKIR